MSAPTKDERTSTLALIAWWNTDLKTTHQDLISPSSEFMVRFFIAFEKEISLKLNMLLDCDAIYEPSSGLTEAQQNGMIQLFHKVSRIYKKLLGSNVYICFEDFFAPQPRRAYRLITIGSHYMIYFRNNLDDIKAKLTASLEKSTMEEHLKLAVTQKRQSIAELAALEGKSGRNMDDMLAHRELSNQRNSELHSKMAEFKKEYLNKQTQLEADKNVIDDLNCDLKNLEDTESSMRGRTVSKEEYEEMQNKESILQVEAEKLSNQNDNDLQSIKESHKVWGNFVDQVTKISFDFDLKTKREIQDEEACLQKRHQQSQELVDTKEVTQEKRHETLRKLKENQKSLENLMAEKHQNLLNQIKEAKTDYEHELTKYTQQTKEYELLLTEIRLSEQSIAKVDSDEKVLEDKERELHKPCLEAVDYITVQFRNEILDTRKSLDNSNIKCRW